jgi:MFS family permease
MRKEIKKDIQVLKFCFYGFFKNLKFFEPYLLLYLLGIGYNLIEIGFLFSIREGVKFVFEIPSGMIADYIGKKKELLLSFIFYISSFILLFFGVNLFLLALGMILFGLGEAFRSGTHKAMILTYLEHKGWYKEKAFVYGRTRSYSLLGSSLSAFIAIALVFKLPELKWVFIVSTIPYVIDFILVSTYPNYLDDRQETKLSLKPFIESTKGELKLIAKNFQLQKIVVSSSTFNAILKTIKDYIQPLLGAFVISAGASTLFNLSVEESLKVYLGLIYGVFYIFSSLSSRNVYRLVERVGSVRLFNIMYYVVALVSILMALSIHYALIIPVIVLYFILYIFLDARRPVFVDVCADNMSKRSRVTVLSIESQLRAITIVIIGPLFGFIAENYSMSMLFGFIGVLSLVIGIASRVSEEKVDV